MHNLESRRPPVPNEAEVWSKRMRWNIARSSWKDDSQHESRYVPWEPRRFFATEDKVIQGWAIRFGALVTFELLWSAEIKTIAVTSARNLSSQSLYHSSWETAGRGFSVMVMHLSGKQQRGRGQLEPACGFAISSRRFFLQKRLPCSLLREMTYEGERKNHYQLIEHYIGATMCVELPLRQPMKIEDVAEFTLPGVWSWLKVWWFDRKRTYSLTITLFVR